MPGPVSDTNTEPPLYWRMRKLANNGHPRAAELREAADRLEKMLDDGPTTVRKMVGIWATARRLWSECSGEPLI